MRRGITLFILLLLTLALTGCGQTKSADAPKRAAATEAIDMQDAEGFVLIQGGSFLMGSPAAEAWRGSDETQHTVAVGDFYMSRCEVTQKEYEEIVGHNPSAFSGETLPVENVSWLDAIAYCNARSEKEGLTPVYRIDGQKVSWDRGANGYRLPTEAEWEYACRAKTTTPFHTETSISAEEANYYSHYPYQIEDHYFSQENLATKPGRYRQTTIAVGSFAPNRFGLHDMHGNVGEWVWDYYGAYGADAQTDPVGPPTGALRVYRGGGWNDFAKNLRSAYRAAMAGDKASFNVGIRLVRNAAAHSGHVASSVERTAARTGGKKLLIAYFSWSGNTEGIARQIQRQTGADLFKIECKVPYSNEYNVVLEESRRDQSAQARPALAAQIGNLEQYDTILLGYPNWWASIPMPVATFLETYDFSGKTLLPFCSHGGGRFGQSLTAISKLVPAANIGEALSVHYKGDAKLEDDIRAWLDQNGIARRS